MTRIFDTVPMYDELDLLECRLTELEQIPNLMHVIVEADVTHQDVPKPSYLSDHWSRFERWHDRIIRVWAVGLPTAAEADDPWVREQAQREHVSTGLRNADAGPDDVVLHGDLDEIPTALVARNVKPRGFLSFEQRGHFWAVDWLYPKPWYGTVAGRVRDIGSFAAMRDVRNTAPRLPAAGWHLSWLGGDDRARHKVEAFCHREVTDFIHDGVTDGKFLTDGWHVDGERMIPVDIDSSWPRWVAQGHAPASWFRPR